MSEDYWLGGYVILNVTNLNVQFNNISFSISVHLVVNLPFLEKAPRLRGLNWN